MTHPSRVLFLAALALGLLLLTGCSKPRLEGVVIPGPFGQVSVLVADDPRLDQVGIPNARVRVTLEGNRRVLVDTKTDDEGRFSVPTSGASMARGMVRVVAEADGYARVNRSVPLRSFGRALYITMVEFHDSRESEDSESDPSDDADSAADTGDSDEEQSG